MTTATQVEKKQGEVFSPERMKAGHVFTPRVDIVETSDELVLVADVPGARADSVDINFEQGELTISARVLQRQDQDAQYLLHEYGVGDFYRVFHIGEAIDSTQISAEVVNGVLKVHLPKAESAKPRKIAVKAG
jgi:HSP20 family protein